jgi:hypothetical protein
MPIDSSIIMQNNDTNPAGQTASWTAAISDIASVTLP